MWNPASLGVTGGRGTQCPISKGGEAEWGNGNREWTRMDADGEWGGARPRISTTDVLAGSSVNRWVLGSCRFARRGALLEALSSRVGRRRCGWLRRGSLRGTR